jgi:hypothetical protein
MKAMNSFATTAGSVCELELLSIEHSALAREQYEALQKYPNLKMSEEDADAIDRRRVRIGEVWRLLCKLRAPAHRFLHQTESVEGTWNIESDVDVEAEQSASHFGR